MMLKLDVNNSKNQLINECNMRAVMILGPSPSTDDDDRI